MARKTDTLTVRLNPDIRAKLDLAQTTIPYFTTITAVVERGVVLALRELEDMAEVVRRQEAKRGGKS